MSQTPISLPYDPDFDYREAWYEGNIEGKTLLAVIDDLRTKLENAQADAADSKLLAESPLESLGKYVAREGIAESEATTLRRELFAVWEAMQNGVMYLDPPDGGDVPLHEQVRRMGEDAARLDFLAQRIREGAKITAHGLGSSADLRAGIDALVRSRGAKPSDTPAEKGGIGALIKRWRDNAAGGVYGGLNSQSRADAFRRCASELERQLIAETESDFELPINDAVPAPTQIQPGNLFLWNWRAMQEYARTCVRAALTKAAGGGA